ncbi:Glycogen debranching enzyme (alpha-1,6-glucosidase) [Streptomyces sp. 1222.5]|uniref:amylo-alpha-1,6-glucosidase n=1 Tax=unclassified Streptomyces TaxID=2593676 RepID=UPI00089C7C8B|nr:MULTISPECIES: glycogen debranching N-terminal domain-containing protein [unclassified Streptomyces]PKW04968.1 glycogen debranching enzyme [Streptomyces sp. 5112.2]SEB52577.1 Glycogen debranching enzyme (alpha-1,6-glucosidase) [Streptomyces sp. 1222.5]
MNPADDFVQLVRDATFARLDDAGNISGTVGTAPDGLFLRDARHLSLWHLTVDGTEPIPLAPATASTDDASTCVLAPRGTRDHPPAYTVFRDQNITAGALTEHLRLVSNRPDPVTARVQITLDADFADLFELRADDRHYDKADGHRSVHHTSTGLELDYRRADWHSRTTVTCDPPPAGHDSAHDTQRPTARTLTWHLPLAAHGQADLHLTVRAQPHGLPALGSPTIMRPKQHTPAGADDLTRTCERGLADVDLLTIPLTGVDDEEVHVPAAGIPWFLTLFGRDSLLTSYFLLPYRPETAAATLSALAATQGRHHDPISGEQPGRIVHETRHGELAHFRQIPYGRYYGAVDATPLFLVLLHAHHETTGDKTVAVRLEQHARRAVDWMFSHGGLDKHGYLVYQPDPDGLVNQNWKDSAGAICFADGTQAQGPIAVSEVQGYAYDALVRTAQLAATVWQDHAYAQHLHDAAAALRARFHTDFWMPQAEFPALALDGNGRQVDALASDAGHLLWSGILHPDLARQVGKRLLQPDFFSGWAIRTLATGQKPYHPLSYHRGSAWPHDNAVIALGLARHELAEETHTVAEGLIEAATHHNYRLPEVLAGYDRTASARPVPYLHSCSPQAWAAATPLALRTALSTV